MDRKLILTLIISLFFVNAFGQLLKVRVGANGSTFQKEVGSPEIEHPLIPVLSDPNATDFTSNMNVGAEGEVMLLWTNHLETGLELGYSKMSGYNDNPPLYNYYFAVDYPQGAEPAILPLIYETSVLTTALNLRYYLLPKESIDPFFKVFGGISFVGTELNYKNPQDRLDNGIGVLYSIGTQNSGTPREPALYYGAGGGLNFRLSDKIALYIDASASFIKSDKLDGIPDFNYVNNDGQEIMEPIGNNSFFTKISIGFVFNTGKDLGWVSSDKKGSSGKRTGRTDDYFPFYRQKSQRFR
jgi:hypothetical protein